MFTTYFKMVAVKDGGRSSQVNFVYSLGSRIQAVRRILGFSTTFVIKDLLDLLPFSYKEDAKVRESTFPFCLSLPYFL